jgi:hypothetical protein
VEAARLTIPACIGCGAMRADASCPGPCAERPAELVSAADYDLLAAAMAAGRARRHGLGLVVAELARTEPRPGEWRAAYQAMQQAARSALRAGPAAADRRPAAGTVTVWRCQHCGGLDAPQPCIGVCIWRPASWVSAPAYAAAHRQATADLAAERSLAGLLGRLAFATPRDGRWEQGWRALQAQARRALVSA